MSPALRFGVAALLLLGFVAVLAPVLSRHDPNAVELRQGLAPPSVEHPFGRDRLGRDLCSRVLHGARLSLTVGFSAVALSLVAGTAIGLLAGITGGVVDEAVMRVVDILLAFPGILLAIALAAVLGPSLGNVILALSAIGWTGYARLVRAETLAIRERPHVEAARSLGARQGRIVRLHVLPLLVGPLTVQATFGLAGAIVAEASLSFLGIGVPPPTPSWGAMLDEGRAFLLVAPHLAIFPGAAVFVSVFGLNLLGDGLRDWLDVRSLRR